MINLLISPIAELAGTWLKGKVDKSKAESEVKVARAKAEAKVYETEATSQMLNEKNLTDQMGDSLKDEFLPDEKPLLKYALVLSVLNRPIVRLRKR